MAREAYKKQVALLLSVLPEVAKEECFALHGGTAINLFVRDMPRLSVDIDLTYILKEDRATALGHISDALERIKINIQKVVRGVNVIHRSEAAKLLISAGGADVKVEVNLVMRGVLSTPVKMVLSKKVQQEFSAFCVINVVPPGQLFGGKICAALDRQHPRDLFDVKYLLANEGISSEIRSGFIYCLVCSDRPIHEVLSPHYQDQRSAMKHQFEGMSEEVFSYEEYEFIRRQMISAIHASLTPEDKKFLLSIKNLLPDWQVYDFDGYPALMWKLQNLQKLKDKNPGKYQALYLALKKVLDNL